MPDKIFCKLVLTKTIDGCIYKMAKAVETDLSSFAIMSEFDIHPVQKFAKAPAEVFVCIFNGSLQFIMIRHKHIIIWASNRVEMQNLVYNLACVLIIILLDCSLPILEIKPRFELSDHFLSQISVPIC